MSKGTNLMRKIVAAVLAIIALIAIISAWDLLLFGGQYTKTVIAMEMGGVVLGLIAYFLWRSSNKAETGLEAKAMNDKPGSDNDINK